MTTSAAIVVAMPEILSPARELTIRASAIVLGTAPIVQASVSPSEEPTRRSSDDALFGTHIREAWEILRAWRRR